MGRACSLVRRVGFRQPVAFFLAVAGAEHDPVRLVMLPAWFSSYALVSASDTHHDLSSAPSVSDAGELTSALHHGRWGRVDGRRCCRRAISGGVYILIRDLLILRAFLRDDLEVLLALPPGRQFRLRLSIILAANGDVNR